VRTVELGRTAAQAELLRIKRLIRRQAKRGVWGAVAAVFAIAVLVMIHVVAFMILAPLVTPVWSAVIVLAFDLVMLAIFGVMAASSKPDRIETQAREVRDLALLEMRESMAVSALLNPVGRVALKAAGRGALGALTPSFMSRKRRK
jgi:hypothetical protein